MNDQEFRYWLVYGLAVAGGLGALGVLLTAGPSGLIVLATAAVALLTITSSVRARRRAYADANEVIAVQLVTGAGEAIVLPSVVAVELRPDEGVVVLHESAPPHAVALNRLRSGTAALVGTNGAVAAATAVVAGVVGWMLLKDLGDNPAGFFCDEAEIGYRTRQFLNELPRMAIFYEHFGYGHLGALPLYASSPFVLALGLSDFSLRLVSVVWSVAALVALLALMRRLGWRNGAVAVALFACSPIFIHIARVNFGHGPTLFFASLGLYAYVRARDDGSVPWAVVAGAALGVSVYGIASSYIATPVIVAGLVVGEVVVNRFAWRAYRTLAVVLSTLVVVWSPVAVKALTDESFWRRFEDKEYTEAPLLSLQRLNEMLDNYPKYFNPDYFFTVGELGVPGGSISRHSVPGAGLFPWIALPLVAAGIIAIFRIKERTGRVIALAGLTILLLYPLPDLPTTTSLNAPYTYSVFPTFVFLPLLAGAGLHWLSGLVQARGGAGAAARVFPIALLGVILFGAWSFWTGPYARYPEVAAGYYGWQFGPRQSIEVFERYRDDYDRYLLDGDFNEAYIFLFFYLDDDPELLQKSTIGGLEKVDLRSHDLFAVRAERFDPVMLSSDPIRYYLRIVDVVHYPSGEIALYLVDVGPANRTRAGDLPR